jgi:hypothetical protein
MAQQDAAEGSKRPRGRSPSYPGIDLEEAIERARQLYAREGKHAAPVETINEHWGYKGNSGYGFIALAALKKFGLLIDEGTGPSRRARLSDDALAIILDDRPDSAERLQRIRIAALFPPIHSEIWGKYEGSLPSDSNLRFMLLRERNFTERGVEEFIPELRATLTFAKLLGSDKVSSKETNKHPAPPVMESEFLVPPTELQPSPAQTDTKVESRVIQLPIAPTEWAALQAPFPLTPEKWNQMLAVLNAMKPALVQNAAKESVLAPEASPSANVREASASLTDEALELVRKVDNGGVPAYTTANLERIAAENGIEVKSGMTPNEIVEALLQRSLDE